jgi:hypothetical protein
MNDRDRKAVSTIRSNCTTKKNVHIKTKEGMQNCASHFTIIPNSSIVDLSYIQSVSDFAVLAKLKPNGFFLSILSFLKKQGGLLDHKVFCMYVSHLCF